MRHIGTHTTASVAKEVTYAFVDADDDDFQAAISELLANINPEIRVRRERAGEWAVVFLTNAPGCVLFNLADPVDLLVNLTKAVHDLLPSLKNLSFDMHPPSEDGVAMLSATWSYEDKKYKEG